MKHLVTPGAFIQLPMTDAQELLALCTAVLAAAEGLELEPKVERARGRLEGATGGLRELLQLQHEARAKTPKRSDRRRVDRALDRVWSAFEAWLEAWGRLDDDEELAAKASELHGTVFHDGLGFVQKRMRVQWAESQKRLGILQSEEARQVIEAHGGGRFLRRLEALQGEYGEVLGLTRVPNPAPAPVRVGQAFDLLRNSLRDYVGKVAASVEVDDPASESLASKLLRPLLDGSLDPRRSTNGAEDEDTDEDEDEDDVVPVEPAPPVEV